LPAEARSAKAGDLTCHSRRDNENEGHRGKTVREGSVIARQQQIEIGYGAEQRAGRDKTDRRAPAVDRVAGVDDCGASEDVADWARHGAPMMADSAIFQGQRRKSLASVSA